MKDHHMTKKSIRQCSSSTVTGWITCRDDVNVLKTYPCCIMRSPKPSKLQDLPEESDGSLSSVGVGSREVDFIAK